MTVAQAQEAAAELQREELIGRFEEVLGRWWLAERILAEHRPERRRAREELHGFVERHGRAILSGLKWPLLEQAVLDGLISHWRAIASGKLSARSEDPRLVECAPHYVEALRMTRRLVFGDPMAKEDTVATP